MCAPGFEPSGDECRDIDENQEDACGKNGTCENKQGGYSCNCAPGYFEDLGSCWPDMVLVSAVSENLGIADPYNTCGSPAISDDGRLVAFLCGGAHFGFASASRSDLLLRDLRTGAIEVVNVGVDGMPSGDVEAFSLSGDGRTIAYASDASALVPGDTNNSSDIFVRTVTGTRRVSLSPSGSQANGSSSFPSLSRDGRILAFNTGATNLAPEATIIWPILVLNLEAGTLTPIPKEAIDPDSNLLCENAHLSGDGRYVIFGCRETGSMDGDYAYVYRHDVETQLSALVNRGSDPDRPGRSSAFAASDDGRAVAFLSKDSGLLPGDTSSSTDVFIRDLATDATSLVSVTASTGFVGTGFSSGLAIRGRPMSADGRFVAFSSAADNLVAGDGNGQGDVFVRDRQNGTTRLVSTGPDDQPANAGSESASLSPDGRFVVFVSQASNFGANTYGGNQIWVKRILP